MKIIQVITGHPQVIYLTELFNGLKSIGVDVKIYCFNDEVNVFGHFDTSHISNVEYTQDVFDELNSCDFVFFNDIPHVKYEHTDEFIDMVVNKITAPKIFFNNIHSYRAAIKYHGDLLKNKEFMSAFDKYVTFDKANKVYLKYADLIGKDLADSRYVHMLHPYKFDDEHKRWKKFDEKQKRITYLGRAASFKDPCRLIKMNLNGLSDAGYEAEMRGILLTIGCAGMWNLRFKFDENGNQTKEKSPYTFFPTGPWRKANKFTKEDPLIDHPKRTDNKVWVFGPYVHDEGMDAVSYSMFGADFYGFDEDLYGDQIEYTLFEMIDSGTIPVFDLHCAEHCHVYENAESTGKTIKEMDLGIFVDRDCSNMKDVISKLDKLSSSKKEYEAERNKVYEAIKKHTDPKAVCKNLIENLKK